MRTERTLSQADLKHRPAPGLWAELSDMVAHLRRDLLGGYRPELHYMRGPGPACRAKQALAAASNATVDPRLVPQPARLAHWPRRGAAFVLPTRNSELAPKYLWA